ncbi:hypothetical protein [Actinophytocola sp.]|uniref:hypothetical protein n=1 Tax=Actinophytocola sp. TaxID=1872138 RepID=UPI002E189A8C
MGGEVPLDLALVGVDGGLPGGEFGVEDVDVVDASVEALAGEGGEFDLGDVEPGPVFALWWCESGAVIFEEAAGFGSRIPRLIQFGPATWIRQQH